MATLANLSSTVDSNYFDLHKAVQSVGSNGGCAYTGATSWLAICT